MLARGRNDWLMHSIVRCILYYPWRARGKYTRCRPHTSINLAHILRQYEQKYLTTQDVGCPALIVQTRAQQLSTQLIWSVKLLAKAVMEAIKSWGAQTLRAVALTLKSPDERNSAKHLASLDLEKIKFYWCFKVCLFVQNKTWEARNKIIKDALKSLIYGKHRGS